MQYHDLFFRKLGKMWQKLSSAAVVIGTLRVNCLPLCLVAHNCCDYTYIGPVADPDVQVVTLNPALRRNYFIFKGIKYNKKFGKINKFNLPLYI